MGHDLAIARIEYIMHTHTHKHTYKCANTQAHIYSDPIMKGHKPPIPIKILIEL